MFTLSQKEIELMELLWDAGEPMERQGILDRAAARECSWKPVSIHVLLNRTMAKGAVRVAGFYLNTKKLGRTYEPAISKEEYYVMQVRIALEKAEEMAGLKPKKVLQSLLREQKERQ